MQISLLRWKTEGLRCPDTEIEFGDWQKTKKVNLIQMPNGTGKSTIIELVEAALTGRGQSWTTSEVMEYAPRGPAPTNSTFELEILYVRTPKSDPVPITFKIEFDFSNGAVFYFTNSDPSSGLVHGWSPPRELSGFLTKNCVEVFIFKGDKAEDLLDQSKNDAELAISAFFRIDDLRELAEKIEQEFLARVTGVKTGQGLKGKEKEFSQVDDHLKKLKIEKSKVQKNLQPILERRDRLHKKVEDILTNQTENDKERKRLEKDKEEASEQLKIASTNYFDCLRNPLFVSALLENKLLTLKENLDRLKLPGTSGEFFKELSEEKLCVCNRPINEAEKKAILTSAQSFLSDDDINIVNGIKRDVSKFSEQAAEQRSGNHFQELRAANSMFVNANHKLALHLKRMEDAASEQQKQILNDFAEIEKEKTILEAKLEHFDKDGSVEDEAKSIQQTLRCKKIPVIQKKLDRLQKDLAKANNTVKELEAKNKLKSIIEISADRAMKRLKLQLKDKANAKLSEILPEGEKLEILEIGKNVRLGFEDSAQRKGSGGQNVSVAYSFATSLIEISGAQFPLIVDHPVTALDQTSRRGVGNIISKICHQFIGFVINTEIPSFLDAIEKQTKSVNYITLYKDIPGNEPYAKNLENVQPELIWKSDNGVVCYDREYFKDFIDLYPDVED